MRALYTVGWWLATPLAFVYLLWRSLRQPAYRRHWGERLGRFPPRADDRPLLWIHAVSVGETRAAQPLVRAVRGAYPGTAILLTHATPTGRETGRALFGDTVAQAYLPYDLPGAQRRFLRAWRPAAGLLMETEVWPNLMAEADRAGVPVALVNARLSARSLARGRRQRALVLPAARRLARVLAQSPGDAARLADLGRPADAVTGNLKFDNAPDARQLALGRAWRDRLRRPVLLAASTRDGEEPLLWDAWRAAGQGRGNGALLVIVPRHPQRFDAVVQAAQAAGLRVARRAALDDPGFDAEVIDLLVGDSMGEMDAWYALAGCAVIGGSLLPFGSQNLIEACAAGCPVLVGPSTFNFAEAADQACAAGAARRVRDARDAVTQGLAILGDPADARAIGDAGRSFAGAHRGATERTMAALAPVLRSLR
jgi:3-deoxy-D-manno-octulosonic-acid transferase